MLTIYGIKNCNTMKKAFDFLNQKEIVFEFFDYKKSVLSQTEFERFYQIFGDKLINKQGTTYRKMADETRTILTGDDLQAIYTIIKDNQSILKRPILVGDLANQEIALIGFDDTWEQILL